jgi:hypothetical protein
MKNYAYTAKDATGALTRGILSAADRAAALEALRSQGLMPVKVEETSAAPAGRRTVPPRVLAYAAIALTLLAGGVWLASPRRSEQPPVKQSPTANERASSRAVATPVSPAALAVPAVPAIPDPPSEDGPSDAPPPLPPAPLLSEPPPPAAPPRPGIERVRLGKREVTVFVANPKAREEETNAPPRRPLFERDTENILALYTQPGVAMPPPPSALPPDIEERVRTALDQKIVVYDDDTEEDIKKKEAVAEMKEQLREHLTAGGTAKDFFTGIIERQENEAALMSEARALISELADSNRVQEAREALVELNAALAEQGLPPVRMSPKYRKLLEMERKQ